MYFFSPMGHMWRKKKVSLRIQRTFGFWVAAVWRSNGHVYMYLKMYYGYTDSSYFTSICLLSKSKYLTSAGDCTDLRLGSVGLTGWCAAVILKCSVITYSFCRTINFHLSFFFFVPWFSCSKRQTCCKDHKQDRGSSDLMSNQHQLPSFFALTWYYFIYCSNRVIEWLKSWLTCYMFHWL